MITTPFHTGRGAGCYNCAHRYLSRCIIEVDDELYQVTRLDGVTPEPCEFHREGAKTPPASGTLSDL